MPCMRKGQLHLVQLRPQWGGQCLGRTCLNCLSGRSVTLGSVSSEFIVSHQDGTASSIEVWTNHSKRPQAPTSHSVVTKLPRLQEVWPYSLLSFEKPYRKAQPWVILESRKVWEGLIYSFPSSSQERAATLQPLSGHGLHKVLVEISLGTRWLHSVNHCLLSVTETGAPTSV